MKSIIDKYNTVSLQEVSHWYKVAPASEFPADEGVCIKYKGKQIALFNFERRREWYACQNLCPHKLEMVISRGLLGVEQGEPKIACPLHKKTFSLKTGENLHGEDLRISVYPVKVENGEVFIGFTD